VVIVEVVTSEERFLVACPCAAIISDYVTRLLAHQNLVWTFGKAIVRPRHTSAMFVFALACFLGEWGLRRWKGLP